MRSLFQKLVIKINSGEVSALGREKPRGCPLTPRSKSILNSGLHGPLLCFGWLPYSPYSHLCTEEEPFYIVCVSDKRFYNTEQYVLALFLNQASYYASPFSLLPSNGVPINSDLFPLQSLRQNKKVTVI